jgi:CheY-like chemotaxis protein
VSQPFRILVADDDATTRLLARTVLETAGFQVEEAPDGRRALAQFRHTPADLVLLDGLMPELDGFAACRAIRDLPEGRRTPVLLLSGLDNQEGLRRALEAGAYDFLRKPLDYAGLPLRVRMILERLAEETANAPAEEDGGNLLESLECLLAPARRRGMRVAAIVLESTSPDLDASQWTRVLRRALRREDPVCGNGGWRPQGSAGGQGWILLGDVGRADDVVRVSERLLRLVEEQSGSAHGTCLGYALFPEDADTARVLLERASTALLDARRRGVPICGSDALRDALARARLEQARAVEAARRDGSLEWRTRPVRDRSGRLAAQILECAVAGRVVAGGIEDPDPDGRDLGLGLALSRALVAEACRRAASRGPEVPMTVRLPLEHLRDPELLNVLTGSSGESGLEGLEIEVRSSRAAHVDDWGLLTHWPGLRLAIQPGVVGLDPGSLAALARLPIRTLALDEPLPGSTAPGRGTALLRLVADWARDSGWRVRAPRPGSGAEPDEWPDEWWDESSDPSTPGEREGR